MPDLIKARGDLNERRGVSVGEVDERVTRRSDVRAGDADAGVVGSKDGEQVIFEGESHQSTIKRVEVIRILLRGGRSATPGK